VLKKTKTESSVRRVWLPKTLAYILREWKRSQDELKAFLADEYQDYNLVITIQNGRPCENRILQKEFTSLKKEAGLPDVVFHSLRHSSTTYKLKLNHGDLKATQGDTGHAHMDMITDAEYRAGVGDGTMFV
jgi:integrase